MNRFYGKYRGKVANNVDPQGMCRLQVIVPSVLGEGRLSWALPCVPYAGNQVGFFAIPPVDANIWVEFEEGNPENSPIWSGCFWGEGETPAVPALAETKVLKTSKATITLSDIPGTGGITIETFTGMKIELTNNGIEINNGMGASIRLTGCRVTVNGGALEVI